jgi:hypothetical protein
VSRANGLRVYPSNEGRFLVQVLVDDALIDQMLVNGSERDALLASNIPNMLAPATVVLNRMRAKRRVNRMRAKRRAKWRIERTNNRSE